MLLKIVHETNLTYSAPISESTVDDYVKQGILPPPIQLGGSVRWSWDQVQASLASLPGARKVSDDPFIAGVKNVSS